MPDGERTGFLTGAGGNMVFTFFIYGLSFFILGIIVLVYPRTTTRLKLADDLWLIALFGIIHGVNEWLDMFVMITPEHETVLRGVRMLTLPVSFFFLVQFGTNSLVRLKGRNAVLKLIPFYLLSLWILITVGSSQKLLIGDIAARYLLCVPGTLLAAYAMIINLPDCSRIHQPAGLKKTMKLTAVIFLCYGSFAGMVVPAAGFFPASIINYAVFVDKVGVPVQFFRTFCAVALAFSVTRILRIFEWETIDSLRKAHDDLENRVRERTASLQALNSELKEALEKARRN
jgi:hypothetical protein